MCRAHTTKNRKKLPSKGPGRMVAIGFGCQVASDNLVSITYTLYLFFLCTYVNTWNGIKRETIDMHLEQKWRSFSAIEDVMWKQAHHNAHKKF